MSSDLRLLPPLLIEDLVENRPPAERSSLLFPFRGWSKWPWTEVCYLALRPQHLLANTALEAGRIAFLQSGPGGQIKTAGHAAGLS